MRHGVFIVLHSICHITENYRTNFCRCGHCQQLVPEYKKAASALKGIVRLGAVNADEHRSIGGQYGVKGFPTLKVFGSNKNSPSDYKGLYCG